MKIVQSLWSARALKYGIKKYHFHWKSPKYHWYSWVLSSHQASHLYDKVELVTDTEGAKHLVDWLQLPYTSVKTALDNIPSSVNIELWAYGKIVTYSMQDEPFFHIDSDVYLWKKVLPQWDGAEIVCQSYEMRPWFVHFYDIYEKCNNAMIKFLPHLSTSYQYVTDNIACNCAIMGGQNVEMINRYANESMSIVNHESNIGGWNKMSSDDYFGHINCVLEQQLLYCSAKEQGKFVTPLFFTDDNYIKKAEHLGYTHMASGKGGAGDVGSLLDRLKLRIERDYPKQFQLIEDAYK